MKIKCFFGNKGLGEAFKPCKKSVIGSQIINGWKQNHCEDHSVDIEKIENIINVNPTFYWKKGPDA